MDDPKNGEFLNHKTRKICVDKKSGHKSLIMYAKSIGIDLGTDVNRYWIWDCYKETSDENTEVVKISHVCWVNIVAGFRMSELSPNVEYRIAYVVKITKGGFGFELPFTLELNLPNGETRRRLVSLFNKPRGEWMELDGGCFVAPEGDDREARFILKEHGGHWKNGLIIKGVVIKPK